MTETYHNQLYSEVQKREITSSKMVEKGEEPLKDGVPEIALAYFEQVPGTTPSQARSAARNVLPLYQTLSKMFGEDVISKGQLAQYIYVARKRGEDDNSITQAMFKMFGKNNEMQGR